MQLMVKTFTKSAQEYKPEQHGIQEPTMIAADATARLSGLQEQYRLSVGASDFFNKGKGSDLAVELASGLRKPKNELELIMAGVLREKALPDVSRNKVGIYRSAEYSRQEGRPVFFDATTLKLDEFGHIASVGEVIDEEEAQKRSAERRAEYRDASEGEAPVLLDATVIQYGVNGDPISRPGAFQFDPSAMAYVPGAPTGNILPQAEAA
jgi:hypothetical protein